MLQLYLSEDPFAWARPFPQEPSNHFLAHWHEIVASAAFYFAIQAASPVVSKRWFGRSYTNLDVKTRLNFDVHVVSMVQCIISIFILLPLWNHPHFQNRLQDPYSSVFGYNGYSGFVSAVSIGYFLWDLYVCLRHFKLFGFGFLLHAFAALYVFVCSLRPYCLPWVPAFLIFELSTPFVNINWFGSRLPKGTISDRVILINGLLLLVTFFLVRIVWGLYAVALLAQDLAQVWHYDRLIFAVVTFVLNGSLDILNILWFSKMLAIAKKKLRGNAPVEVIAEASIPPESVMEVAEAAEAY